VESLSKLNEDDVYDLLPQLVQVSEGCFAGIEECLSNQLPHP